MTRLVLLISTILALPLIAQRAQSAPAIPLDAAVIAGTASEDALTAFAAAHRSTGGGKTANVNRNANVNKSANIYKSANINKSCLLYTSPSPRDS